MTLSETGHRGDRLTTRAVLDLGSAAPGIVPLTLQDSLRARLDRLGRAKDIAQIASVFGRQFA